jgi:hypothetical protein
MPMTKKEIETAVRVWPANAEAPLTRNQQIELMTTARVRHLARIEKTIRLIKGENDVVD